MIRGKIGVVAATALSVTIVVGAGLLALPGLTFQALGGYGYLPWIVVGVAMIPILYVFSFFGKTFPSAGGGVGYVRLSLGPRWAHACDMIVMGTFSLGIPAIALIGASYFSVFLPLFPNETLALGVVVLALILGIMGMRISGAVQTAMAVVLALGLLAMGLGCVFSRHAPTHKSPGTPREKPPQHWQKPKGPPKTP